MKSKHILLIVLLLTLGSCSFIQSLTEPKNTVTKEQALAQMPEGFTIIGDGKHFADFVGDLTGDGVNDLLILAVPQKMAERARKLSDTATEEELEEARNMDDDEIAKLGTHLLMYVGRGNNKYEKLIDSTTAIPLFTNYGLKPCEIAFKEEREFGLKKEELGKGFWISCTTGGTLENNSSFVFIYQSHSSTWELVRAVLSQVDVAPSAVDDADDPAHARIITLTEKDFGKIKLTDFNEVDGFCQYGSGVDFITKKDTPAYEGGNGFTKPVRTIPINESLSSEQCYPSQKGIIVDYKNQWLIVNRENLQSSK